MAAKPKLVEVARNLEKSEILEKPIDTVLKRRTQEQIIAICGPVGSGKENITDRIVKSFRAVKYDVEVVKASDLILEAITTLQASGTSGTEEFQCGGWNSDGDKIEALQNMGDFLRKKSISPRRHGGTEKPWNKLKGR